MVAGLLFARAGVPTIVLKKHGDFLRDFRGDTIPPSTLRIFSELGLLESLLRKPHDKVQDISGLIGGERLKVADFQPLRSALELHRDDAAMGFPRLRRRRGAALSEFRAAHAHRGDGPAVGKDRILGVRTNGGDISAKLVLAADGRRSLLRNKAALPVTDLGAPMDVFWFRLPKARTADNRTTGIFDAGHIIALIDRGDYWQVAYVFAKSEAETVRSAGLDAFRAVIARVAPMVADQVGAIRSWDDVKLLTVALDRLETWHLPGLLVIGDAAHAMSPIGGVGINVAIQDAVAAANILAGPMAQGRDVTPLLPKVARRRRLAVRAIQGFQRLVQRRIIGRLLADPTRPVKPPLPVRLLDRLPLLRRLPAAFLGFGIRPEHVRSPDAGLRSPEPPSPSPG